MSSDDDFDEAAYEAFEDQLYEEQSSSGSDDDLDNEVEEALYCQVHYASSLLVSENSTPGARTPKTRNLVDKSLDAQGQKCQLDSSVIVISSDDEDDDKVVKNDDYTDNHGDIHLSSSLNYPEVVKIFADNNNLTSNETTDKESSLAQSEVKPGEVAENWNLNEKDLGLEDSKTTKQRQRYYAPGKGLPHVRCYNCNEKGHLSQNCPEPKKISVCFLCGGVGHLKRFCPNELCFNCYEPGHMSKQCRKPRRRPFDRCGRCHVLGHLANDCPDRWRQYHLTIQVGPVIRPSKPVSPSRPVYCYNCGDQGHYGHECQEENESRRHELPLPFVVNYNACQMTASRQKKEFDKRTPERRSNNDRRNQTQGSYDRPSRQQDDDHNNGSYQPLPNNKRRNQVSSQGFFDHQSRQQDYDDDKSSCPSLRNNKRRNQVSSQGFNDRESKQEDYDDDKSSYQSPPNNKRQNKIQGFYDHWSIQQGLDMDNNSYQPPASSERRNQASSQRFNDHLSRKEDYDMDSRLYQPPPEKIRRLNDDYDDDDLRRVLLQSDSYKSDEYNSQYTDRILPKKNKKKNNREQTGRRDERIVEILDPSPPDDGLIEEPYQPKKKKAKKRGKQHWQERDNFNDNFNSNNFNARNNSSHRNERRFSNPNRNEENRSFKERQFDSRRTSFNPKKRKREFVSDRGFRFNNEPQSKKSNPQFWKRYTF